MRPGWDQPQHNPAPQAYPAYPGPSETQRYAQQQGYYPQSAEAYDPPPVTQRTPAAAQEDAPGGYGQYSANDFYRQGPSEQQTQSYATQSYAQQTYERGPATERYAVPQPPAPKTVRESYYQQDSADLDQHGLMGGGDPVTQRFAPQTPAYETRREPLNNGQQEDLDPRAGNYPIARTTHDDELDADFFGEDDDFDLEADERPSGGRTKLVAAVLAGAVLLSGGGYYYFKSHRAGGADGAEPPTFADTGGPVKDTPSNPGGRRFGNGSKTIYDRLGVEGGGAPTSQDASPQQAGVIGGGERGGNGSIDDRIERALQAAKGQPGNAPSAGQVAQAPADGTEPRKVTTFRVNPDGSTVDPAPRQAASDPVGSTGGQPFQRSMMETSGQASAPADEGEGAAPPVERQPAKTRGRKPEVIAKVDAAPVQTVDSVAGGYYAQVGARNDQNQALAALAEVQSKYGAALGSYAPVIRRADLGAKGVWYRVWVGPIEDKDTANTLCDKLKGAGLKACLVQKE